jgi:hypothetical protein
MLEPAEASIAPFETSITPALVDPPYKSCSIDPLFFLSLNLSSLHLHTVATSPLAIPHDCISTRYSNMTSTTLVRVVTPMGVVLTLIGNTSRPTHRLMYPSKSLSSEEASLDSRPHSPWPVWAIA